MDIISRKYINEGFNSKAYMQSAVTNGHWCGGKRPQCGASAASLS